MKRRYPVIDVATGTTRPRASQGDRAADAAVRRAQTLTCLVRDESADGIGAYLDTLDIDALYGVTVALAAMVPDDRSAQELLAWVHERYDLEAAS